MKKILVLLTVSLVAASSLMLASCSRSDFSMIAESEKYISIDAKNASKNSTATVGGFETADGEQIEIASTLEKGVVRVEIYAGPEDQSADVIPEPEGDPVMTFDASGSDKLAGTVDPGYYFVIATVTEKATGNIVIEAKDGGK